MEEDWTSEKDEEILKQQQEAKFERKDVPPEKLFGFAKVILLFLFFLFLIIVSISIIFINNEEVRKIWSFSSVAINSLVSVLIGYYFTGKKQ
jgi:cell division protein FtsL